MAVSVLSRRADTAFLLTLPPHPMSRWEQPFGESTVMLRELCRECAPPFMRCGIGAPGSESLACLFMRTLRTWASIRPSLPCSADESFGEGAILCAGT
jgi:hypothetical protein